MSKAIDKPLDCGYRGVTPGCYTLRCYHTGIMWLHECPNSSQFPRACPLIEVEFFHKKTDTELILEWKEEIRRDRNETTN